MAELGSAKLLREALILCESFNQTALLALAMELEAHKKSNDFLKKSFKILALEQNVSKQDLTKINRKIDHFLYETKIAIAATADENQKRKIAEAIQKTINVNEIQSKFTLYDNLQHELSEIEGNDYWFSKIKEHDDFCSDRQFIDAGLSSECDDARTLDHNKKSFVLGLLVKALTENLENYSMELTENKHYYEAVYQGKKSWTSGSKIFANFRRNFDNSPLGYVSSILIKDDECSLTGGAKSSLNFRANQAFMARIPSEKFCFNFYVDDVISSTDRSVVQEAMALLQKKKR